MANCSEGFGKREESILTTQLGIKFYCAKRRASSNDMTIFGKTDCLCGHQ